MKPEILLPDCLHIKESGCGMPSPARIQRIFDLHDALTRDKRDVVVIQAITSVTDRREMSPDRTQAIYDEIRRLDQARVNRTSALPERNANNTPQSDGMTAEAAQNTPRLMADAIAISNISTQADAC
jgi:predicted molibdopterin-dependent oxidoreductase YjgC